MKEIKKGDIVSRKSYGNDIIFSIKSIIKLKNNKKIVILKGIDVRIEADAPIEDLQLVSKEERIKREKELEKKIINKIEKEKIKYQTRGKEKIYTGKILHLDGDKKYSQKSMLYYKKIGLDAIVKNISENQQPKMIYKLLQIYKPDILVITRS